MKACHVLVLAAVSSPGALAGEAAAAFGPKNCVSLSLSTAGTCVINTNCQGVDLEHFEFAFDCTTPKNELQRHSFGMGGFDAEEEFDTDVQCRQCRPPAASAGNGRVPLPKATTNLAVQGARAVAQADADAGAIDDSKVVKYGPEKCVSVYKGGKHCIMKTACSKVNTSTYEFGLICVDKNGAPTRHLFGTDSFDPDETFDTLIECDQCLGLEDIADDIALTGQVVALGKEIKSLKTMMTNLTADVEKLNDQVFPGGSKNASANATAKDAANKSTNALMHQHTRRMSKKMQSAHKVHKEAAVHRSHHQAHHKKQRSLRHRAHRHQDVEADAVVETDEQEVDANADAETQEVEEDTPAPEPVHHRHPVRRSQVKKAVEGEDQDEMVEDEGQDEPETQPAAVVPAGEEGADQEAESVDGDTAAADSVQEEAAEPAAAVQDDADDAAVQEEAGEDTAAAAAAA